MRECKDEGVGSSGVGEAARCEYEQLSRYIGEWLQVNPNDVLDSTKEDFIEKASAGKPKRDRDSVRKTLNDAMDNLEKSIAALGRHLRESIEFTPEFRYNPRDLPAWDFGEAT